MSLNLKTQHDLDRHNLGVQLHNAKVRITELEDAIRGIILCTKEPGGACVCIQYAEAILNKK